MLEFGILPSHSMFVRTCRLGFENWEASVCSQSFFELKKSVSMIDWWQWWFHLIIWLLLDLFWFTEETAPRCTYVLIGKVFFLLLSVGGVERKSSVAVKVTSCTSIFRKQSSVPDCALSINLGHVVYGFMFCSDPTKANVTALESSLVHTCLVSLKFDV